MTGPFGGLAPAARRRWLGASFATTAIVGAALTALGGPLTTEAAPLGIVSFELAGDLETAQRILASWDEDARIRAGLVQGLDFLFLLAYPTAIALACTAVGARLGGGGARAGGLLAWGQLAAGAFDAVENVALIALLLGSREAGWAPLAAWAAAPKFALVTLGLVYAIGGGGVALLRRPG